MLGFLGVNGFACGFNVNFFVPKVALSFPLDTSLKVEFIPELDEVLLLITLLELFIFCCCGVLACGGVLGPCDFS